MKKPDFPFRQTLLSFYVLITIFFVACSSSNEPSTVLDYRIEKFDLENNAMDVVFTVTNNTSIDFVENKW